MRLLGLLLVYNLLIADGATNFPLVHIGDGITLVNVLMITKNGKEELYYNGKKLDDRYKVISCYNRKGFCLVDKTRDK